jgi:lysozyme family protein
MKANFDKCLAEVLNHEGGFVDHPKDPGGATNKGITIGTLRQWQAGATVNDLRNISDALVVSIYRKGYWDAVRGDDLPSGLDMVAFDAAVNSGPRRGALWLQYAVGVAQDGKIGPQTLAAAEAANRTNAINEALDRRLHFMRNLPHWPTFALGWSRRIAGVRKFSHALAAAPVSQPLTPNAPALTQTPNWLQTLLNALRALFVRTK